jgi:hypothetical protein
MAIGKFISLAKPIISSSPFINLKSGTGIPYSFNNSFASVSNKDLFSAFALSIRLCTFFSFCLAAN